MTYDEPPLDYDALRKTSVLGWPERMSVHIQVGVLKKLLLAAQSWEAAARHERARAEQFDEALGAANQRLLRLGQELADAYDQLQQARALLAQRGTP